MAAMDFVPMDMAPAETAPAESKGRLNIYNAGLVLLVAGLASRARLDAGIALAILGLVLAYARGMLAVPVVAILAAVVCAPAAVGGATAIFIMAAPVLAIIGIVVYVTITLGIDGGPRPGGGSPY